MANWVRLWEDMPTDPKWRVIARRSGRPLSEVIAVFIFMMTNAGANATERGKLFNWDDEDVAAALDMDGASVEAIREAMEGKTLDQGQLTGWDKRQPKREDNSSERAKAWRENNKRKQAENDDGERTRTHANAEKRPDTDTDTDISSNEDITRKRSIALDVSQKFERFYAVYPKRTNRKPAILKFCSAVKSGVDPEHIINAAGRFAEAHRLAGTDKQYIPAPDVWLNKGRYDDEDLPAPVARAGPTTDERSGVAKLLAEAYGIDQRDGTQAQGDPSGFRQIPVLDGGERIENYGDDGGVFGRLLIGDGG